MNRQEKIINGQKISFVSHIADDSTPVVVFLHGWGSRLEVFKHFYPLCSSYIALDFPGFGFSSSLSSAFTLQNYSQSTANFLKTLLPSSRKIILVGHSFGGRVILKMLSENLFSHSVEKIVFIGVPFYRKISSGLSVLSRLSSLFSFLPFLKPLARKIFYTFVKNSDYEGLGSNKVMKQTFRNIISEDVSVFLPILQNIPLVLMWGENDEVTPMSYALDAKALLPHAQLITFSHAGHLPFFDKKEEFLEKFEKVVNNNE